MCWDTRVNTSNVTSETDGVSRNLSLKIPIADIKIIFQTVHQCTCFNCKLCTFFRADKGRLLLVIH